MHLMRAHFVIVYFQSDDVINTSSVASDEHGPLDWVKSDIDSST